MLKSIIGKTVYIAETGKHKRPIIRCLATIPDYIMIDNKKDYNSFRKETRIKKGSTFDWKQETKRKYLYRLENVQAVNPFLLPENAEYHGRVYAIINK